MTDILTAQVTELLTTFLGRAPTAAEIANGIVSPVTLAQTHNTLNASASFLAIDSTDDFQDSLDKLSSNGGGELNLDPGVYTLTENILIPSGITINGRGTSNTIITGAGQFNMSCTGSSVYTTGTIVVASGVFITGSGTLWLANVTAGQSLFLGTRWYTIAAVTSNSTLILAEAYGDNVTLPSTYRIATPITDINLDNFTITGTPAAPFAAVDCRRLITGDLQFVQCGQGPTFENIAEIKWQTAISAAHTGTGITMNNCGLGSVGTFSVAGNVGNGWVLNNVKNIAFQQVNSSSNSLDGFNGTTVVGCQFYANASANGSNGLKFVSNSNGVVIYNSDIDGNGSDGIELSATCDYFKMYANDIRGNSAYGINIASASCDENLILGNTGLTTNSSGSYANSGTTTLIRSNPGVADN